MRNMNAAGWEKIKNVEVEQFFEGDKIDYEVIWIKTVAGDILADTPTHGETAEGRAALLRERGYTDARCCLFTGGAK